LDIKGLLDLGRGPWWELVSEDDESEDDESEDVRMMADRDEGVEIQDCE
jgi:hypothetical protein